MKHSFKPGQFVTYIKRDHGHKHIVTMRAKVVRISRKRVVLQDRFGRKHYVKPASLAR